eukprot:NODE_21104_length_768_cov_8.302652.p4 GENE.NODE_21104_length_768_cov_8.302652~~NODE_21104_length_768_cov_8.302652.p4  ORF type:complete len:80 (-),score=8.57 NODE_21104_length_768_cov_8.302652:12-251(-)
MTHRDDVDMGLGRCTEHSVLRSEPTCTSTSTPRTLFAMGGAPADDRFVVLDCGHHAAKRFAAASAWSCRWCALTQSVVQ